MNRTKLIIGFIKLLANTIWSKWKKQLQELWFEAKLEARMKMIDIENRIQAEKEIEESFEPIYKEEPINDELQTGESRLLGGAMQLSAPWYNKDESNETQDS
jgi:hypothetical protein